MSSSSSSQWMMMVKAMATLVVAVVINPTTLLPNYIVNNNNMVTASTPAATIEAATASSLYKQSSKSRSSSSRVPLKKAFGTLSNSFRATFHVSISTTTTSSHDESSDDEEKAAVTAAAAQQPEAEASSTTTSTTTQEKEVSAAAEPKAPQYPPLPKYTSPPTETALKATPDHYKSDEVIEEARRAAAAGECFQDASDSSGGAVINRCQMVFEAADVNAKVGIVYYGGALIDPRAYAPTAQILAQRYGIPTVIPIFANDLAFDMGKCYTRRIQLAKQALPHVEKWVVVGHSFGGIAAMSDVWTLLENQKQTEQINNNNNQDETVQIPSSSTSSSTTPPDTYNDIGGLVMIASYIRQDIGCGAIDFSATDLPMAMVTASEDGRVNKTNWEAGNPMLSKQTYFMDILGGNHGGFAAYDDSERALLLNQTDGVRTIPPEAQWESTVTAIYNVVARVGVELPLIQLVVPPIAATYSEEDSTIVDSDVSSEDGDDDLKINNNEDETPPVSTSSSSLLSVLTASLGASALSRTESAAGASILWSDPNVHKLSSSKEKSASSTSDNNNVNNSYNNMLTFQVNIPSSAASSVSSSYSLSSSSDFEERKNSKQQQQDYQEFSSEAGKTTFWSFACYHSNFAFLLCFMILWVRPFVF